MKNFYLTFLVLVLTAFTGAQAQLVTTSPSPLQQNSPDVVLTYHADSPFGNRGLLNLPQGYDVYAHIGVITNLSSGPGDWLHVVTPWPSSGNSQQANTEKNRLTRTETNIYTLAIGDIRTYFGITDPAETVQEIVIVFRTADGSREGKTSDGADIRVPVLAGGFQVAFDCDAPSTLINATTKISFTLTSTEAADLTIAVGSETIAQAAAATKLEGSYTFDTQGTYTVTGTARTATEERSSTINVAYLGASETADYPGGTPKMGAVKNADGSVTFCLAAPGKTSVMMVPAWDDYQYLGKNIMKACDYQGNRYFWLTVDGLADDQWYPYYYVVDGKQTVADPYAHLVLDCYNDNYIDRGIWPDMPKYPIDKMSGIMLAVYRGDMDKYDFAPFEIPDHDNLVIYEMLFRDFTGNNGVADGNGTVRKAIEKIPYIKSLGFNAVELMPIMEFNGNNSWGYNTNFYMAPDKAYGSPTDYKDFIDECHRQGIAVILDIVFNQSDGLHPWYQMYTSGSNPFYNAVAPHAYSVLNDWNQDNELVQQQWTDALRYWMEAYNVDGYRFDLVKGLGDNASYAAAGGTDQFNQSRVDRMARLHAVIKSVKPNGIHINENLAGAEEETLMGENGQLNWANINNSSCQYTMGYASDCNLYRFLSTSDGNRPQFSTVSYAESHDEERMGFKNAAYGQPQVQNQSLDSYRRLGSLAVQMLMTPGPKMVWMFGELGNDQTTKNPDGSNNTDPKIVDWNWLDNPEKHALMETYASVINLRGANPDLFSQGTFVPNLPNNNLTTARTIRLYNGDSEVLVFINPNVSGDPIDVSIYTAKTQPETASLLCASPEFTPELRKVSRNLVVTVPANCFAIYINEAVSAIDSPAADGACTVATAGRTIVVKGEYRSATVYNAYGQAMPSFTVPAGIYIVVVDGTPHKIAVH